MIFSEKSKRNFRVKPWASETLGEICGGGFRGKSEENTRNISEEFHASIQRNLWNNFGRYPRKFI